MPLTDRKERAVASIEGQASELISLGEAIWAQPELGYKERATARLVADFCRGLGLDPTEGIALTGVKAVARGGRPGPTVGLICELDAVVCFDHPAADKETGAVHACGHNMQVSAALGALVGLIKSGVLGELAGSVALIAVPAEESIEIQFRQSLQRAGKISYLGGKQEFLHLGVFDDVDLALNVHADAAEPGRREVRLAATSNGFLVKTVRFAGRAAHAGAAPWDGVNALNACLMGLMGIHAQRETFRDADTVRVHPIITNGGAAINVVPSEVTMETYVRAATAEAMRDANFKVSRALRAGADCVGAQVDIADLPGYLPVASDPEISRLFLDNASVLIGQESGPEAYYHFAASSDMGDVTQYLPSILASVSGAAGGFHSSDFRIVDREMAYVTSAELLALTVIDLLAGDAGTARAIKSRFTPRFTREGYAGYWAAILGA